MRTTSGFVTYATVSPVNFRCTPAVPRLLKRAIHVYQYSVLWFSEAQIEIDFAQKITSSEPLFGRFVAVFVGQKLLDIVAIEAGIGQITVEKVIAELHVMRAMQGKWGYGCKDIVVASPPIRHPAVVRMTK